MNCDGGKYCDFQGLVVLKGLCDLGFFCLNRVIRLNFVNVS